MRTKTSNLRKRAEEIINVAASKCFVTHRGDQFTPNLVEGIQKALEETRREEREATVRDFRELVSRMSCLNPIENYSPEEDLNRYKDCNECAVCKLWNLLDKAPLGGEEKKA